MTYFSSSLEKKHLAETNKRGVAGDRKAKRKGGAGSQREVGDVAVKLTGWQGLGRRKKLSYLFTRWYQV